MDIVHTTRTARLLTPGALAWPAACFVVLATFGGCKLPGRGPVSGEVLNCRQLTQRGISAMDRGEWDRAETYLGQAIAACPVDCESRRQYAEALWRRGARQEAVAQLQEAIRLSSDDPALTVRLGEMQLAQGQLDAALAQAGQALDLDPRLASAWLLRGQALEKAGQLRPALADYHRALSCDADNREALLRVAELYRQLNQPQRALVTLQTLFDTYRAGDEPQQLFYLTGLAYAALGRHDDAADSLRLAARQQPTPEILYHLAQAELATGRPENARAAVGQALELEPLHGPSQALLERLASAEGRSVNR